MKNMTIKGHMHDFAHMQSIIDQLRKELAKKDDEIKRLEKEMGDFGTIGYMSAASDAKEALRKKDEVIKDMREVLEEVQHKGYYTCLICNRRARDCLNKLSIGKNEE